MKLRALLVLTLCCWGCCLAAVHSVVNVAAQEGAVMLGYEAVVARLKGAIEHEVEAKKLSAFSLAFVDGQKMVWAAGFGHQDAARKVSATADTIYRVGSVSKLFTDIAVMQLVERGELDLDAPVTHYLPEFKPHNPEETAITLRQLMSHRSGLVGSGQALELGRRGDADLLLTHSPAAEKTFMEQGWGDQRRTVIHNDFVLAGPPVDPAQIKGLSTIKDVFEAIAETGARFASRGHESGTHQKELSLWKAAGTEPRGDWYLQTGAGMAQTLRIADEKEAYVLCDRATYLTLDPELQNVILFEKAPELLNHYSVLSIAPSKHPHLQTAAAEAFAEFLISPKGQQLIASFGVENFGQPLFVPDAESH